MRIACPSCSAEYEVPDRLLAGAGRTLRCSRCAAEFALPALAAPEAGVEPPPPPAPVPVPVPVPAAAPMPPPDPPSAPEASPPAPPVLVAPERPRAAAAPGAPPALVRAWVASVALVLGGVVALLLFRAPVMQAWPPATRLFSALGLA